MNAYPSLQVFTTEAGSKTKMCLLLKPGGGNVLLNLSNTEQKINEEPRLLRALREGEDTQEERKHDADGCSFNSRVQVVLLHVP